MTHLGKICDFFALCDLEMWQMTLTDNRASLLCYFKLCASFHSHRWIQTRSYSPETANLGQNLQFFVVWPWNIYIYIYLSSTLPEIDPDTAYVVCISISLGFRQKPSDTALFLVIALTTFNCIVSASVTKGALACFVVTVHWWRHRTHYDVTEVYRTLRNILTVHLNNGAICADLRGIPKHYEVTAKAGR